MANPMMQALNKSAGQRPSNPLQMIRQFAQFKKQMQGKNPQEIVQELLDSGQMTREQFEALKQQAKSLQGILK